MAKVIPFKGIRPSKDKAPLVPSLSIESYSKPKLKETLASNPYSYLNVVLPDHSDGITTKANSNERLLKIKRKLHEFIEKNILIQDKVPCFYIYRQTKNNHSFTGIIGCSSIDDYFENVIKGHEQTLVEREKKLQQYLDVCEVNAEPVLFAYPDNSTLKHIVIEIQKKNPDYDFVTEDKITHHLWVVNDKLTVDSITTCFSKIPNIYIADGHHRTASSAILGKNRRTQLKKYSGKEPFNFFMGIYFPESELKICEYNRLIKDLNGLNPLQFLKRISEHFIIEPKGQKPFKPIKKNNFGMYLDGNWYSLLPKFKSRMLDALLLSETILHPILNISDERKDKRIAYVPGTKGLDVLKEEIDSKHAQLAFVLYPVSMKEIKIIADNNQYMPPKTTWIEPKLRSGMILYSLEK